MPKITVKTHLRVRFNFLKFAVQKKIEILKHAIDYIVFSVLFLTKGLSAIQFLQLQRYNEYIFLDK